MSDDETAPAAATEFPPASGGRLEAFTDAVVAIALTLLVLPLLESTVEAETVAGFLHEHGDQVWTFLLSFVLIAFFWMLHHRVFRADTPPSALRTAVTFGWLVTIVVMPVTTAMIGLFDSDRALLAVYIGDLALCAWLLLAVTVLETRSRRSAGLAPPPRSFLAVFWAQALLYTVALVIALVLPAVGFLALFLMVLTAPVRRLLILTGWFGPRAR